MNKIIFWNVDTQIDFMLPEGKLYIQGAEKILPNLKLLTDYARKNEIKIVNTRDFHSINDKEISNTPDFVNTFPQPLSKIFHRILSTSIYSYSIYNRSNPQTIGNF